MTAHSRLHRSWFAAAAAAAAAVLSGVVLLAASESGTAHVAGGAAGSGNVGAATPSGGGFATGSPLIVPGTVIANPTIDMTAAPPFPPIDVFATPSPAPARGALPTDPSFAFDPRRSLPVQSTDWLELKAAGRIAVVGGALAVLPSTSDPLVRPSTGLPLPAKAVLDTTWTRWVVEPPGYGTDEKGNRYSDLSYWNLCGDGAMTVALWYWQELTSRPNVTGTAGYFLDPYAAQGVSWPSSGPEVAVAGGTRLGTYWSGTDRIGGFTANGRGFLLYLAMQSEPATWESAGLSVFARNGKPVYPTPGTSRANIQTGLNWEISGRDPVGWTQAYYASVIRSDPTLARDLTAAVMLDVGRDGVPVVGAVDGYDLPNWQDGAATRHVRHAIAIVGYDNTSNPPTFTYVDTCGRACNARGGNQNGQLHVIAQPQMVLSIQNAMGSGFVW